LIQTEKSFDRDPITKIIRGAESFEFFPKLKPKLNSDSLVNEKGFSHAILFIHGWTSTPRELKFLAEKLSSEGFYCQGILLKGHGLTLSDLTPTKFSDYLNQCELAYQILTNKFDKVSLCGLSMGGLLSIYLAKKFPISNLILIAPFLKLGGKTFGLPNDFLLGRIPLKGNLSKQDNGAISDPVARASHIAYHAMPVDGLVSIMDAARKMREELREIKCPTVIHHSVKDETSDFSGSLRLMQELGSGDKTLRAYNTGNHVISLDYPREELEHGVVRWMEGRG
jgi:carboxylesterase